MSNLDGWLKVLEEERQKAIARIKENFKDERLAKLYLRFIEISYEDAKIYLGIMAEKDYPLSPTLEEVNDYGKGNENYNFLCTHVGNHLARIRLAHKKTEEDLLLY
ncbi:MAG TPA: hypothetical protein VMC80_00360 [Patescibacteria group bacterium]|nr:hypothetical protein [Patescibacteria group bacterium]